MQQALLYYFCFQIPSPNQNITLSFVWFFNVDKAWYHETTTIDHNKKNSFSSFDQQRYKKNLSKKNFHGSDEKYFRNEQKKKPSLPLATFFSSSWPYVYYSDKYISTQRHNAKKQKKIFWPFFLPTSNHYSVYNCNKFFPRIFFFNLNECRIHNHNKHKKIATTRCVPWYIYFLPERKIVDLSGIIFQIFLKWKRNLSKKMISHFIKNRNWVALTPPNNMASSTSTKKTLRNYSLP